MAAVNPPSDMEGTMMTNGLGPSREDKTSVVANYKKKESVGKNDEVEGIARTNGSGPPPEDNMGLPDSEEKGNENKSDEEEDGKERKGTEERKHDQENDTAKANGIEESKQDKKTEDMSTIAKANDIEESKEDKKTEDVKMADAEGDKAVEAVEDASAMAKENDIEESKADQKTEHASTAKAEDEKMADMEGDKGVEVEDVKMVDVEDDKDEEGGGKEGEEDEIGEGTKGEENDMEEGEHGSTEKKVYEGKKAEGFRKKRSRGQKAMKKSEGKDSVTKAKELLNSPMTSSIERPVRERKTVERLVEVIEKETAREFQVEKGRGTPLKDIPNVAHKLAKKKPADIKLIHQTLFGRKGKAVNFKNHILQFSGFVWHESDIKIDLLQEKQRAKMKEKLDKYVKDTLLDLCDLFDLPVSKANTRKEDLVAKLLDFLVAPHPTTEVIISEKNKQSTKSRKRKWVVKGSSSKSIEDTHKQSRKKRMKSEAALSEEGKSETENEDDEEDYNKSGPYKGKAVNHSDSEGKESEFEDASEEDEHDKEDSGKGKKDKKKALQGHVGKEKKAEAISKRGPTPATAKSPTKTSSSKRSKAEDDDDVGAKVFSRKKKVVDSPKKRSTPRSAKKEKDTGKKVGKEKAKSESEQPSKEELRKKICEILKEVDFNTATFTDILKQLATHYKVDLTPRKSSIKLLIQEELTKLAKAEEDEDDEDEDAEEEENLPAGKEVEV